IHDLAVWYHLAWLGATRRRADPLVARLTERGRDFSAAHRRDLLALIGELVGQVLPRYRRLAEAGRCELSVTPYGHPILPLLLDFRCARDAVPEMPLPRHAAYPGGAARAAWHVEEGIRVFERAFGHRPAGCWPAEGAISAAALQLLAAAGGFRWAASGAAVLRGSLELTDAQAALDPLAFSRPYRLAGTGMDCFFRDDMLSDLIGFTYATWHGDDAVANLANELTQLARRYEPGGNHAVLIALDGENAWEHYPFNGFYFLRALYEKLAEHPQLELMTLSECLARGIQPTPLPQVMAGSWVHGTLATWMGDAAKNRAWDLLCDGKEAYDRVVAELRAGGLGATWPACDCPCSIGAARARCCRCPRSRQRSGVAAAPASTGWPRRGFPSGRSCPQARWARIARPTGCAPTAPGTPHFSTRRSCRIRPVPSIRSSWRRPPRGSVTTRCSKRSQVRTPGRRSGSGHPRCAIASPRRSRGRRLSSRRRWRASSASSTGSTCNGTGCARTPCRAGWGCSAICPSTSVLPQWKPGHIASCFS